MRLVAYTGCLLPGNDPSSAGVAELADALASGASPGNRVEVRVLSSAPTNGQLKPSYTCSLELEIRLLRYRCMPALWQNPRAHCPIARGTVYDRSQWRWLMPFGYIPAAWELRDERSVSR